MTPVPSLPAVVATLTGVAQAVLVLTVSSMLGGKGDTEGGGTDFNWEPVLASLLIGDVSMVLGDTTVLVGGEVAISDTLGDTVTPVLSRAS